MQKNKRRGTGRAVVAILAAAILAAATAPPASAAVVWDGDASGGTGVFEGIECESPATLTVTGGTTFRFEKSVGEYRCEARGIAVDGVDYDFAENRTYWFGWDQNVGFTSESAADGDWVAWQWKSYPNADQNYPLLLRVDNGALYLTYVAPDDSWTTKWSTPVEAGDWHRIAIGIHTSSSESEGWVELYLDGVKQVEFTGSTWDSDNKPKWGAYDRDNLAYEIVNNVRDPRMGTTLADVD